MTTDVPEQPFQWSEPELISSDVDGLKLDASPSGASLSLFFKTLAVSLPRGDGPLADTKVVRFRVPVTLADDRPFVGYIQDLSFNVTRTGGARVLLVADVGGTAIVYEAPDGAEVFDAEKLRQAAGGESGPVGSGAVPAPGPEETTEGLTRSTFALRRIGARDQYADPSGYPGLPAYEGTILVSVQGRTANDRCEVSIDALDVLAVVLPPVHLQPPNPQPGPPAGR